MQLSPQKHINVVVIETQSHEDRKAEHYPRMTQEFIHNGTTITRAGRSILAIRCAVEPQKNVARKNAGSGSNPKRAITPPSSPQSPAPLIQRQTFHLTILRSKHNRRFPNPQIIPLIPSFAFNGWVRLFVT